MTPETCKKRTGDSWHPYPCGKTVVDRGLCARHLAAQKRKDVNDAKLREESDVTSKRREDGDNFARAASELLGVKIRHDWEYFVFTLDRAAVETLLEKLGRP
jgi:hypothetical protein